MSVSHSNMEPAWWGINITQQPAVLDNDICGQYLQQRYQQLLKLVVFQERKKKKKARPPRENIPVNRKEMLTKKDRGLSP